MINFLRFKGLSNVVYVCGATAANPYGEFKTAVKTVNDIVAHAYLYHPAIGHVVEIQIGEPFALVALEIDSARRDNASLPELFGDGLLYNRVKGFVLDTWIRHESERERVLGEVQAAFRSIRGNYGERLLTAVREIKNATVLFPTPAFSKDEEALLAVATGMRGCMLWQVMGLFSHEVLHYLLYFTPENMLRPLFSNEGLYDAEEDQICPPVPYHKARTPWM
jgi:hypothetical protein